MCLVAVLEKWHLDLDFGSEEEVRGRDAVTTIYIAVRAITNVMNESSCYLPNTSL